MLQCISINVTINWIDLIFIIMIFFFTISFTKIYNCSKPPKLCRVRLWKITCVLCDLSSYPLQRNFFILIVCLCSIDLQWGGVGGHRVKFVATFTVNTERTLQTTRVWALVLVNTINSLADRLHRKSNDFIEMGFLNAVRMQTVINLLEITVCPEIIYT